MESAMKQVFVITVAVLLAMFLHHHVVIKGRGHKGGHKDYDGEDTKGYDDYDPSVTT